ALKRDVLRVAVSRQAPPLTLPAAGAVKTIRFSAKSP
ncbi:uncharacterized, partial [Tachysurus ichikawai]